jgi:hypothetical protein
VGWGMIGTGWASVTYDITCLCKTVNLMGHGSENKISLLQYCCNEQQKCQTYNIIPYYTGTNNPHKRKQAHKVCVGQNELVMSL